MNIDSKKDDKDYIIIPFVLPTERKDETKTKTETDDRNLEPWDREFTNERQPTRQHRFAIADKETGKIIDNAQGYGYTSKQKAHKAAWYKFKGGKNKIDTTKSEAREFWSKEENKEFRDYVETEMFYALKDGDELTDKDIEKIAERMEVEGFKIGYVRYMP